MGSAPYGMGRHRRGSGAGRLGREPVLIACVLVAALVGSAVAVKMVGSAPSRPAASGCVGETTTLSVGADPAATPWLSDLLKTYNSARRVVDGTCVRVALREMTLREAQQALQPVPFPGGGAPPDVWVPESSAALDLTRSRPENGTVLPKDAPAVASSPIVVAGPADAVRALTAKLPAGQTPQLRDYLLLARDPAGWGQQRIAREEWGRVLFSTADPTRTTLGASLLVATAGAITGTPARDVSAATFAAPAAKAGLLQFARSVAKVAASGRELLAEAGQAPSTQDLLRAYGLVVTYEQDVWRYNGETPAVQMQATYPLGGALAANFPFVVPNASWISGLDRRAAADLRGWLMTPEVQDRLDSYGLRRANGTAGADMDPVGHGLDSAPHPPDDVRAADAPAAARAAWRLLTRRVSVLALIDVSGSMAEKVPGTELSKLQVVLEACRRSLGLFDDADTIGLWEFSTRLDGDRDYRELVPLGPAGGKVGGVDRRRASVAAYAGMRPRTGTGLYDSVLAAYGSASKAYRDGYVNALVVLSDGQNDDSVGISLDELLAEFRSRYRLAAPVHVVTLAYGKGADTGALARIAKATDGLSFVAPDPRDIGQVFLTAMGALTS